MAWDNAVVTNNGVAMLQQVLAGETLILDGAAGGTGTVTPSALMAQTALKTQKQTFSIVGVANVTNGKKINILITSNGLATGYTLQQIGIWAHVGSNPSALFAILQDDTGIAIPSETEIPDFAMNFYSVVDFNNESDFSLIVDTSALVSLGMLNKSIVGLGNVDNTSDMDKPVSIAQQAALDGKEAAGTTAAHAVAEMPHIFTDETETAYRYGFRAENGRLIFMYEEVT